MSYRLLLHANLSSKRLHNEWCKQKNNVVDILVTDHILCEILDGELPSDVQILIMHTSTFHAIYIESCRTGFAIFRGAQLVEERYQEQYRDENKLDPHSSPSQPS